MANQHSTNLDILAAILQTIGGSPVTGDEHRVRVTKTELSLAFSALDEIQQALGDCPSPLPTPESLCCTSCKGSGASAPDGTECSWCAGSGLREGVTIRDVEEAYAVRPSPAPTISVEEALTSAVRKADEAFERVGGSSRHWVRDCFLPALEAEGLCVSRLTGAATRSETIEVDDDEALDVRLDNLSRGFRDETRALLRAAAARLRSLASHPASEAGEARPSVDVKALRAEMLNALANEWPMFRDASDECESKRMDYDEAELFVREAFDIAVKKLGAALYERGAK